MRGTHVLFCPYITYARPVLDSGSIPVAHPVRPEHAAKVVLFLRVNVEIAGHRRLGFQFSSTFFNYLGFLLLEN